MFAACRTKIDAALTGRNVYHLDSSSIRNERITLPFFIISVYNKKYEFFERLCNYYEAK